MNLKAVLLLIPLVTLTACTATRGFTDTPVDDAEFSKEYRQLKEEYADIENYERWFASPASSPHISDLVEIWGEPDTTRKRWFSYLLVVGGLYALSTLDDYPKSFIPIVFALQPVPREKYTWEKAKHKITVYGRNDLYVKYDKRMFSWKWKHKD